MLKMCKQRIKPGFPAKLASRIYMDFASYKCTKIVVKNAQAEKEDM